MDEKSLFLLGALNVDPTDCVAKADSNAKLLAQGVWDLAFASNYTAFLLLGNQLVRPSETSETSETERVSLRSAEITLASANGTVLQKYSSVATGFIDAATASPAYAVMAINLIPSAVGMTEPVQNAQLLIAKIRVSGEALNGTLMTSSELDFPIRVCTGCLLEYPAEAADPTAPLGSSYRCSAAPSTSVEPAPRPCIVGQDQPFSCTLCAAAVAMCRDPSLNPSFAE